MGRREGKTWEIRSNSFVSQRALPISLFPVLFLGAGWFIVFVLLTLLDCTSAASAWEILRDDRKPGKDDVGKLVLP